MRYGLWVKNYHSCRRGWDVVQVTQRRVGGMQNVRKDSQQVGNFWAWVFKIYLLAILR